MAACVVQAMNAQIPIGLTQTHVGCVLFSDQGYIQWQLTQYYDINSLSSAILNLQSSNSGATNAYGGLTAAQSVLQASARTTANKV